MNTLSIQNLKCGGCANTITKGINAIEGVENVNVDVEKSTVSFDSASEAIITAVKEKLSKMGYPEMDANNSVMHKAKSFVSCATGRINK